MNVSNYTNKHGHSRRPSILKTMKSFVSSISTGKQGLRFYADEHPISIFSSP